jgi:hypothetical protein
LTARRLILLVGAIVLIAGIVALVVPVSASGENGSVGCGNAIAGDLSTARDKDNGNLANLPVVNQFVPHTNYVSACTSALSTRRGWSIPLAVTGLLVMGGSLLVRERQRAR